MTDTPFDRRLRDWLEDRDPGPVPASLHDSVARVPIETPVPAVLRLWHSILGPGRAGRQGAPIRAAVVLVVLGLLVAAVAALWSAGSRPAPLTAWREYAVGQPVPDLDFGSPTGTLSSGDASISVDDIPEAMFVLYFPGDAAADRVAADARVLVDASEPAPGRTAFLVIPSHATPMTAATVDRVHAAGMLTAEPPAGWPATQHGPVLVITNHRGNVAYIYVDEFPDADGLIGDLDRASVQ
jgi:hypothetical protein